MQKSARGRAVVARRAHNPEVVGSNPTPATRENYKTHQVVFQVILRIMLNKEIQNYLKKIEQGEITLPSFHGENSISQEIKNILAKDKDYNPTKEDMAEQMAFDFFANYPNNDLGWGTYYGPMFVLPNDKGEMVEYPSINRVGQEMLEYWGMRTKEAKNPILSSRYSDLVIDFSPKIIGKPAEISLFQNTIDLNLFVCGQSSVTPLDCKTKIKRALILAIQTNDQLRISKIKRAIIDLEMKIGVDEKLGLWGFSFKWLILDFSSKVALKEKEKDELVNTLEKRLERIKNNPQGVEHAVSLLAEYYANEKDENNLMRVLNFLEESWKTSNRIKSNMLIKMNAYERIHEIYRKYASCFKEVEKANKRLSQEIGQLNLNWDKSLKEVSTQVTIKKEEIDDFLKGVFGESGNENLKKIMTNIAIIHLPKKDDVKKQLEEISGKYPLQFLIAKQIISDDGIPIAKLLRLEEDYDNHFQSYAFQHIQYGSITLSFSINELKKRFSKEQIIDHFNKAALFKDEDKKYLERAISAYWDNDFIISSHLFTPLIESTIRELVKESGGIILLPNDIGGYRYLSLNVLFKNDEIFNKVFSQAGHNILFYFKLVLTENLGMNLRNDFAHGLGRKKFFGRDASDRLFHILIWLSFVGKK